MQNGCFGEVLILRGSAPLKAHAMKTAEGRMLMPSTGSAEILRSVNPFGAQKARFAQDDNGDGRGLERAFVVARSGPG